MKLLLPGVLCMAAQAVVAAPAAELPVSVVDAFESYIAVPGKVVPQLQKARDKDSADAAAPGLKQSLTAIYTAREKLHNLPRLTPAQTQLVRQKYGQSMREEWAGMYTEIVRLRNARCYQSAALADAFHLLCIMIEK